MSRLPTSTTRSQTPSGRLTTNAASGSLTRRRLGSRRVQLYLPTCQQQSSISAAPGAHGRVHAAANSGSESHPHWLLCEQPAVVITTSSSSSGSSSPPPLEPVCSSWHPLLQRCWLGLGALTLFLALPAGSVSTRHAAAAATAATPRITTTADVDSSSSSSSSSNGPASSQPAAAVASAGDDTTASQAASSSSGSRWWWRNVAADVATGGSSSSSTVSREGLADPSALRGEARGVHVRAQCILCVTAACAIMYMDCVAELCIDVDALCRCIPCTHAKEQVRACEQCGDPLPSCALHASGSRQ
jgi:hypothetical protein